MKKFNNLAELFWGTNVKNNPDKFPQGYVLSLSKAEKNEVIKNFDNLEKIKFSPKPPNAFTERELYMLATILKGSKATQTTLTIGNIKHESTTRNIAQGEESDNFETFCPASNFVTAESDEARKSQHFIYVTLGGNPSYIKNIN